jgi:hypothetical protein
MDTTSTMHVFLCATVRSRPNSKTPNRHHKLQNPLNVGQAMQ